VVSYVLPVRTDGRQQHGHHVLVIPCTLHINPPSPSHQEYFNVPSFPVITYLQPAMLIYLLIAIGLTPGGSTHLHTNSTQKNTNNNRTTQITNNVEAAYYNGG
jgi:hypothetical protein